MARHESPGASEVEPGLRGLWFGILAYRWATFAWMAVLAAAAREDIRSPGLALAALVVVGSWNLWFTLTRGWERSLNRWIDLGLAIALLPISGIVMREGTTASGAPFFATSYPASAALTVGAGSGLTTGLAAGAALSVGLALSRTFNGLSLGELSGGERAALLNGAFYYVSAGGAAGIVRRVLTRSAAERSRAIEEAARQRERAARLAEREALGREIHDSVLQALAMVGKKGKELTSRSLVPAEEVRGLVALAAGQEQALRALLTEAPDQPAAGTVSLRTALQAAVFGVDGVPVTITTAGPVWLPAGDVEELSGAVHQALENVAQHARATTVTIFAEEVDGELVISIRDDGVGFDYDEERLTREGKLGLLKSMKGRIEALGGEMRVHSAPRRGAEVEFRLPTRGAEDE
ncbi:MAG: sensor histidine kinase [Actinomycetota bacterium]